MQRVVDLWKMHAREYLGMTCYLERKVAIYFDAWFSSPDYRRQLCRSLDIEFSDAQFARVTDAGGGSSFDGTKFDGDNLAMDVLNRERHLVDWERRLLDRVLADHELRDLSQRIRAAHEGVFVPTVGLDAPS